MSRHPAARLARECVVVAAYALITVIVTFPAFLSFPESLPGPPGDNFQFYWNLWWIERAMLDLHTDPFYTREVLYPQGSMLHFHTLNFAQGVLALPLVAAFDTSVGYAAVAMLGFAGGGYAAYRLALVIMRAPGGGPPGNRERAAALVGGSAFTFTGFHVEHLAGHLDMVSVQWLPLYAAALVAVRGNAVSMAGGGAAAMLTLTALTSWYFALDLYLFTLLFAVYHCGPAVWASRSFAPLKAIAVVVGWHVVAISPVLLPMLRWASRSGRPEDAHGDAVRFSADLVGYFTPSPLHPVWGGRAASWEALPDGPEGVAFLGYLTVALAVVGLRDAGRRHRFWALVACSFAILSMGPVLHVGGRVATVGGMPIPLPYAVLERLPYAELGRLPVRMAVMVALAVAMLAALGAASLLRKATSRRTAMAAAAALVAGVSFEQVAVPFPTTPLQVPPFYDWLAGQPREGALLEVPAPAHPALRPERMFYQTRHGHPTFGGYLSRSASALPMGGIPGLSQYHHLDLDGDVVRWPRDELLLIAQNALHHHGVGWVAIDRAHLSAEEADRARQVGAVVWGERPPDYDDGRTMAYRVSPDSRAPAYLELAEGWGPLESGSATVRGPRWRWMGERASLTLHNSEAGVWRLDLEGFAHQHPRRLDVSIDAQLWGELRVRSYQERHRTGAVFLGPGRHVVALRSLDGTGRTFARAVSVAATSIALRRLPAFHTPSEFAIGSEDTEPWLGPGWSYAEQAYRWTDGEHATVYAPLVPRAAPCRIGIRLAPFLAAGRPRQRVEVAWNGWSVARATLDSAAAAVLSFDVTPDEVRSVNVMTIATPDAVAPRALGSGPDGRRLGVAVEWIRFETAASAAAR